MADTTALKNRIRAAIKSNDNQEITGPVLQQALLDMVDELNGATETEAQQRQSGDSTLQQNITAEAQQRQNGDSTLQQGINTERQQRQDADTQLNNLITGIKNNIDNGYVYAGIATPSTMPVTGRVFYLALTAGTYTNFDNLIITQGINILKYNGSAWSLDIFMSIDDEPTAESENLIASGGLYKELTNLTGIIDNGTTYNEKDATNRVCAYYSIPNKEATYRLKVSNVVLSNSSNTLLLAFRSAKTPYSATLLEQIGAGNYNHDTYLYFTIPQAIRETAKYISIVQKNTDGTASFKVELNCDNVVDKKIDDSQNNITHYNLIGGGDDYSSQAQFKTTPGKKYVVALPKIWTVDTLTGNFAFIVAKHLNGSYTNLEDTHITVSDFANRPNYVEFVAEEADYYSITCKSDAGQHLTFIVYYVNADVQLDSVPTKGSNNAISSGGVYNSLLDLDKELTGIIDGGTTYDEKDTTNRVCVYYEIPDVAATYRLKVSNVSLSDTSNVLQYRIRSAKTPYSATSLSQIFADNKTGISGIEFTIPQEIRATAKYIAITQKNTDGTASFDVELTCDSDTIDKKISDAKNNISLLQATGKGETSVSIRFKTVVGNKYVISLPKIWTINSVTSNFVFIIRKITGESSYENVEATRILTANFSNKPYFVDFVADGTDYELVFRGDFGQYLFMLYSLGDFTFYNDFNSRINNIDRKSYYIDYGSTEYNEKYGTTNRTCKFYEITNKDVQYDIEVFDTVVPASNELYVALLSDTSPYGAAWVSILATITNGLKYKATISIPEEYKAATKYLGVFQHSADSALCSFKVKLCQKDALEKQIDALKEGTSDSDVIPYNDTIFTNGRTIKIYNPYKEGGSNQYAGQMHCHSWNYQSYNGVTYKVPIGTNPNTGSAWTVEEIAAMTEQERNALVLSTNQEFVNWHKTKGFSFMTITNYDNFADYSEAPATMPENFIWLGNGFEGNIGGWDSTGQAEDQGAHIVVINTNFGKQFAGWDRNDLIKYCEDRNAICAYAHPFISCLYSSPSYVREIKKRLRFIEVYNGMSYLHADVAPGVPTIKAGIEIDEDFDTLLTQGNFIFCTAVSDERNFSNNVLHGCIRLFANSLSNKTVFESLMSGNFYASSDVRFQINGISISDNGLFSVDVGFADATVEFVKEDNTIVSTVTTTAENTTASYQVAGNEKFIRARVYMPTDTPNAIVKKIWTQAIRLSPIIID